MPDVFGPATTLTIHELTGEGRTLTLAGRALPYRPISFSGTQRLESTWYPGNPHATVQILGAKENQTTLRGQWKNRFIESVSFEGFAVQPEAIAQRDGVQIADVETLAEFVDDIRRKGQLLEVAWRRIKRQGFLETFVQNWGLPNGIDLDWEMTFEWISQADAKSPAVLSSGIDLGDIQGAWQITDQALALARSNPPFQQFRRFRDTVDSMIAQLSASSDEVVGSISNVVIGASDAQDGVRRLASVTASINVQAQALRNELTIATAETDRFSLPVASTAPAGVPSFSDRLRANVYSRGIYDAARASQSQANLQRDDLTQRLDPQLLAAFVARDGENLRTIARMFYGTQAQWGTLLTFNQLSSSRLSAGQVVFVPKLTAAQV